MQVQEQEAVEIVERSSLEALGTLNHDEEHPVRAWERGEVTAATDR